MHYVSKWPKHIPCGSLWLHVSADLVSEVVDADKTEAVKKQKVTMAFIKNETSGKRPRKMAAL